MKIKTIKEEVGTDFLHVTYSRDWRDEYQEKEREPLKEKGEDKRGRRGAGE